MRKCQICGEEVADNSKYCPKCGVELEGYNEPLEGEVINEGYDNDNYVKEQAQLRDEYARRASNSLTLSIVSIVLCCCSITAIISLIFSITLILDMKKMSPEIQKSEEYHKIRNKNIIAIVLSGFAILMWLISFIENLINPVDYDALYDSIYGELMNSGYYE